MKSYSYRGCHISRITAHNMAGMRWESYILDRFVKTETLADMRAEIAYRIGRICGRARPGQGWRVRS